MKPILQSLLILLIAQSAFGLEPLPVQVQCTLNNFRNFLRAGPNQLTLFIYKGSTGPYLAHLEAEGEVREFKIEEAIDPDALLDRKPITLSSRDGFRLELLNFAHDIQRSCRPGFDCREIWFTAHLQAPLGAGMRDFYFESQSYSSFCAVTRAYPTVNLSH